MNFRQMMSLCTRLVSQLSYFHYKLFKIITFMIKNENIEESAPLKTFHNIFFVL